MGKPLGFSGESPALDLLLTQRLNCWEQLLAGTVQRWDVTRAVAGKKEWEAETAQPIVAQRNCRCLIPEVFQTRLGRAWSSLG